jgi:hypothetical protein
VNAGGFVRFDPPSPLDPYDDIAAAQALFSEFNAVPADALALFARHEDDRATISNNSFSRSATTSSASSMTSPTSAPPQDGVPVLSIFTAAVDPKHNVTPDTDVSSSKPLMSSSSASATVATSKLASPLIWTGITLDLDWSHPSSMTPTPSQKVVLTLDLDRRHSMQKGACNLLDESITGGGEIELDATTILDVLPGAHTVGKARCASYADRLYASASCTTPDQALNGHYTDKLLMLCSSNITNTMPTRCSTLVPTPTPMPEIVDGTHPQCQAPPSVSAAARKTPDDLELGLLDYYGAGCRHSLTSRVVTLSYHVPELLLSSNSLEAKALLEAALMEANKERKKNITGTLTTKPNDDDDLDKDDDKLCLRGICLELACTMEVQDCGHQMYVAVLQHFHAYHDRSFSHVENGSAGWRAACFCWCPW